jgi:predicted metalloenzyme YecM
MNETELRTKAGNFLVRLFAEVIASKFELRAHWNFDHLCYRVETFERYQSLRSELASFAEFLAESMVNGRPISCFRLRTPIWFQDWAIDLIELPAPKPGKPTKEGFEHIEIVPDLALAEIIHTYPNLNFSHKGMDKFFNQELEISFASGALKFHSLSLASVVKLEQQPGQLQALRKTDVLRRLRGFDAALAGTIPLGLTNETSDFDVICTSSDLQNFANICSDHFSGYEDYRSEMKLVREVPSRIVKFLCEGIPFEIFCQNRPVGEQWGYVHFLAEERLLKLGGAAFAKQAQVLRAHGMKTEPAIMQALGVHAQDPHAEILRIAKFTDKKIKDLYFS